MECTRLNCNNLQFTTHSIRRLEDWSFKPISLESTFQFGGWRFGQSLTRGEAATTCTKDPKGSSQRNVLLRRTALIRRVVYLNTWFSSDVYPYQVGVYPTNIRKTRVRINDSDFTICHVRHGNVSGGGSRLSEGPLIRRSASPKMK